MQTLIIYGSQEGQTRKIAEYIAELLREKEQKVTTLPVEQLPTDRSLNDYDAVIIGGSIHVGKYPKSLKRHSSAWCTKQFNPTPCRSAPRARINTHQSPAVAVVARSHLAGMATEVDL
ncbi:MAG: flavodoxin domain-containing protein [Thiohalophilus sp.]